MNNNIKIIMVSGKARHGKTTLSNMIRDAYRMLGKKAIVTSFAKYIKLYAKEVSDWDGDESTKPRELLQEIGDIIRDEFGKVDFFVKRLVEDIDLYKKYVEVVIIDDARLLLEIEYFRNKYTDSFTTIYINRPNYISELSNKEKNHKTEVGLDNYSTYDYTIVNDKSLDDLRIKAKDIVRKVD